MKAPLVGFHAAFPTRPQVKGESRMRIEEAVDRRGEANRSVGIENEGTEQGGCYPVEQSAKRRRNRAAREVERSHTSAVTWEGCGECCGGA